jgi:hypothetical protein
MKIKLRKPVSWYGPYQLAETLLFWMDKYEDDRVHKFGTWLAGDEKDTLLYKVMIAYDKVRREFPWNKDVIKIDYWDSWSLDQTLSPVILPVLKQLKETKHGSGFIDLEDVPEHMRTTDISECWPQLKFDFVVDYEESTAADVHTRYEWALNEMIWAFEQIQPDNDWENQYWITRPEMDWDHMKEPFAEGEQTREVRWLVEGKCDWDGRAKHQARINNGLRLFGKYYQTLWD